MDYEDLNWTMQDKGEEIFVFFELFCLAVIITTVIIEKIIDWIER